MAASKIDEVFTVYVLFSDSCALFLFLIKYIQPCLVVSVFLCCAVEIALLEEPSSYLRAL